MSVCIWIIVQFLQPESAQSLKVWHLALMSWDVSMRHPWTIHPQRQHRVCPIPLEPSSPHFCKIYKTTTSKGPWFGQGDQGPMLKKYSVGSVAELENPELTEWKTDTMSRQPQ